MTRWLWMYKWKKPHERYRGSSIWLIIDNHCRRGMRKRQNPLYLSWHFSGTRQVLRKQTRVRFYHCYTAMHCTHIQYKPLWVFEVESLLTISTPCDHSLRQSRSAGLNISGRVSGLWSADKRYSHSDRAAIAWMSVDGLSALSLLHLLWSNDLLSSDCVTVIKWRFTN